MFSGGDGGLELGTEPRLSRRRGNNPHLVAGFLPARSRGALAPETKLIFKLALHHASRGAGAARHRGCGGGCRSLSRQCSKRTRVLPCRSCAGNGASSLERGWCHVCTRALRGLELGEERLKKAIRAAAILKQFGDQNMKHAGQGAG